MDFAELNRAFVSVQRKNSFNIRQIGLEEVVDGEGPYFFLSEFLPSLWVLVVGPNVLVNKPEGGRRKCSFGASLYELLPG
jgi:hypothetical protein